MSIAINKKVNDNSAHFDQHDLQPMVIDKLNQNFTI